VVSSTREMPRKEYAGLDISSMLASGPVLLPTMPSDGLPMDKTFLQFPQNGCLSSAKNPMEWQSQSEVSTVPTSGVSETPTSEASLPPGLEDQIPIPKFLTSAERKALVEGARQIPVKTAPLLQVSQPSLAVEESPKNTPPGFEGKATLILSASTSPKSSSAQQLHPESSEDISPDHAEPKKINNAIASFPAARLAIESPEPMYILPQIAFTTQVTPHGEDTRPAKRKEQDLDSADDNTKDSVDDPQVLRIAKGLGVLSLGSLHHSTGRCQPCRFFKYEDAHSCQNGTACLFCHVCSPREWRARKKRDKTWKRMVARQHNETVLNRPAQSHSMKPL